MVCFLRKVCGGFGVAGTLAFHTVNHHWSGDPVLVLHSPAVSTLALPLQDDKVDGPPGGMRMNSENIYIIRELPCDEEVDAIWYAVDVFVPLLDLRLEERCSITTREEGVVFRAFSVIYKIIGAIVTPIMLLSVSGTLRRYIEK